MNQPRDGGPAYPFKDYGVAGFGCSLRDLYAGQALANPELVKRFLAKASKASGGEYNSGVIDSVARRIFYQAQAMVDEKHRLDALDAEAAKA